MKLTEGFDVPSNETIKRLKKKVLFYHLLAMIIASIIFLLFLIYG